MLLYDIIFVIVYEIAENFDQNRMKYAPKDRFVPQYLRYNTI